MRMIQRRHVSCFPEVLLLDVPATVLTIKKSFFLKKGQPNAWMHVFRLDPPPKKSRCIGARACLELGTIPWLCLSYLKSPTMHGLSLLTSRAHHFFDRHTFRPPLYRHALHTPLRDSHPEISCRKDMVTSMEGIQQFHSISFYC